MPNFPAFAQHVHQQFTQVAKAPTVLEADIEGDALFALYLSAFPEGTNHIFRKRPEHDCSCCKQFIRRVGRALCVTDKGVVTVWDRAAVEAPFPYNVVAGVLRDAVASAPIAGLYRVGIKEASFGVVSNHAQSKDGNAETFHHLFSGEIPKSLRSATAGEVQGEFKTTAQVFKRGLTELRADAVATVLSLIDENALYRGAEHRDAVVNFQSAQKDFANLTTDKARELFVWTRSTGPAARFRNTVIGTLVVDMSEGVDIEHAVKSFENKVAPQNYKRTSALITPAMVKQAMQTIQELGLEPALERRFARMADISVNDVLWVDSSVKPMMKGGIGDVLMQHAVSAIAVEDVTRAEPVTMDAFMRDVLPTAGGMELLFKGQHLGNLMSLTAPVHPEPRQLFRWGNDFAWSYAGNVADSFLRKQVQALGGRVDGVLRFSHMWNHEARNASLMDLHVFLPGSSPHREGCHDSYPTGQRVGWNNREDIRSGGVQDVDYVDAAPDGYVPVENITFPKMELLSNGRFVFKIHNWRWRSPTLGGFKAEIEFGGQVFQYDHPAPLRDKEWVTLAVATLKNGAFSIEHIHPVGTAKQDAWGLSTERFVKVNAVTLSPNHWGNNAVGNKHTFFVLDGARNDEPTRGIYNEFLHPRLEKHRKVFEVIGDKTKCQPTDGQLSGLGFSSTKRDAVVIKVKQGKKQRLFNVNIGA